MRADTDRIRGIGRRWPNWWASLSLRECFSLVTRIHRVRRIAGVSPAIGDLPTTNSPKGRLAAITKELGLNDQMAVLPFYDSIPKPHEQFINFLLQFVNFLP